MSNRLMHSTELNKSLTQSQLELEMFKNKYSVLYELAPISYFTFNENGLIIDVNQLGAELLGIERAALINKSFSRYITAEFQNVFLYHLKLVLSSETLQSYEIKISRRDGSILNAHINSRILHELGSNDVKILSFIGDNSFKHYPAELSKNMFSTEHANSLHELSTHISHELNQPLAVMSNFLQGCINRLKTGKFDCHEMIGVMKKMIHQTQRISEITLRMRNLICKGALHSEVVSADSIIQDAISMVNHEVNDMSVVIHPRIPKNIPLLYVDKIQIEQVIINLLRNSIEAMRDAGTFNPKIIIEVTHINPMTAEISVMDNGPGLDPDIVSKLFYHHFTTKSYGVGLGLAVSKKIMEAHGGNVWAKLDPPYGACFKLTIPVHQNSKTSTFGGSLAY